MNLESAVRSAGSDFDKALQAILGHFGAQIGTIHTMGSDGHLHMRAHSRGIPEPVLAATQVVPVGKGIAGLAVERKAPVSMCNLQQDKSGDARPGARATGAMGSLCVPILSGDEAVGALGIASMGERTFTDEETQSLLAAGRALAESVAATA
jgi:GAF domain-containing protein